MKSLIGKKIGMTNVYDAYAKNVAVTVIEIDPCVVTQVKTQETDGYEAVQIAAFDAREKSTHKAQLGSFSKAGVGPKKVIREIRNADLGEVNVGDTLKVEDLFKEDEKISVSGISKGRGFAGVMKRHNFGGVGDATHGQHNRLRAPGSIGQASDPSRVFPGTKMAGRYGGIKQTTKGLTVVKILSDSNVILVKGAVPGPNGGTVMISKGN